MGEALPRRVAVAVAVACFAVYVAGLAPGMYWLDSSEFAAASFELGVAHPPGHPLAVLLGKACALVPLGPVAFRVGLASAIAAAVAAYYVARIAAEVARRAGDFLGKSDVFVEAALGGGAAAAYGLSYAAAFQAVRPEVYALHAALVLGAAFHLLRLEDGDRRGLYLAALLVGLALANHHFLALAFAAAALPFVVARRPGPRLGRALAWTACAGALGLAAYAYLPLRALAHPEVDWGAPSTAARFFWTVSARAFQKSLAHAGEPSTSVAFALVAELGVSAPLALLGAYLLLRLRETRRIGLLLVGAAALGAAAPALVGFDSANPDAYGYLAPSVAMLACLGAAAPAAMLGLARRTKTARRVARGVAVGVAVALAGYPALSLGLSLRPRFADTDRFAAAVLDGAPPRAALVTSNFQTVFALWYARGVEGRRADLDHVHRHFLAYPGYRDEAVRRAPSLAPWLGERDVVDLPSLAARRPVAVEYDLDLAEPLLPYLAPTGAVDRFAPSPPDEPARAAAERAAAERIDRLRAAVDRDEPQTLRALYWLDFQDAHRSCRAGRPAAAVAIARARALLQGATDPDLEDLARRCVPSGIISP